VNLPKASIKSIIDNPEQYALEFGELIFVKNLAKYKKAYEMGIDFATENLKQKTTLYGQTKSKNKENI
tara:strand:- start:3656 stop:3859 length:204 start_codon:yes stop_codon:yes gene_type:complete